MVGTLIGSEVSDGTDVYWADLPEQELGNSRRLTGNLGSIPYGRFGGGVL